MYKVQDQNLNIVGYYDKTYIYNKNYERIAEYKDGEIKGINFLPKVFINYKDGILYQKDYIADKTVATYENGKVYEGAGTLFSPFLGYYEGNHGFCAAFLLTYYKPTKEKQDNTYKKEDQPITNVGNIGGLSELLILPVAVVIILAILYAILKTAISVWTPNIDSFSIQMLIDYIRSGYIDANDISFFIIIIANITIGIIAIIKDKETNQSLIEKILKNYKTIYIPSIIICEIITFCLIPNIVNIIPIAVAGAIVSIAPAIISGIICYIKNIGKR